MGTDGLDHDNSKILDVVVAFYKNLFKGESRGIFSLGADFWDQGDMVSAGDLVDLEAPFNEQEIRDAVFSCYPEGSPSPNGLPFLFYQKFWGLLRRISVVW
jgi:hypothetical protein